MGTPAGTRWRRFVRQPRAPREKLPGTRSPARSGPIPGRAADAADCSGRERSKTSSHGTDSVGRVPGLVEAVRPGDVLVVDGDRGEVIVNPDEDATATDE